MGTWDRLSAGLVKTVVSLMFVVQRGDRFEGPFVINVEKTPRNMIGEIHLFGISMINIITVLLHNHSCHLHVINLDQHGLWSWSN